MSAAFSCCRSPHAVGLTLNPLCYLLLFPIHFFLYLLVFASSRFCSLSPIVRCFMALLVPSCWCILSLATPRCPLQPAAFSCFVWLSCYPRLLMLSTDFNRCLWPPVAVYCLLILIIIVYLLILLFLGSCCCYELLPSKFCCIVSHSNAIYFLVDLFFYSTIFLIPCSPFSCCGLLHISVNDCFLFFLPIAQLYYLLLPRVFSCPLQLPPSICSCV